MAEAVIGVDLGATKMRAVIVDRKMTVFDDRTVPTPQSAPDVVSELVNLVHHMHGSLQQTVVGVGIGMPGFITPSGKTASCPNIAGMDGYAFSDELRKRLALPVAIENDANCFALAEWAHGAGRGAKNMVGVIVGSGLGFGLILDGKLYTGSTGGAGEFHHSFFGTDGRSRFHDFCSARTLEQRYLERAGVHKDCRKIFLGQDDVSKELVLVCHQHLGLIFSYVVNLLNPEKIVVGGGVSNSLDMAKVQEHAEGFCYGAFRGTFSVMKNSLGSSSGIYGAAELIFRALKD